VFGGLVAGVEVGAAATVGAVVDSAVRAPAGAPSVRPAHPASGSRRRRGMRGSWRRMIASRGAVSAQTVRRADRSVTVRVVNPTTYCYTLEGR
jgi:hypothetical protein